MFSSSLWSEVNPLNEMEFIDVKSIELQEEQEGGSGDSGGGMDGMLA